MPHNSHIINTIAVSVVISLLLVLGFVGYAAAQTTPSDRDLFDFPDTIDLYLAYHPVSEQAVFLVPAEGVATMVFETTPFEQIHAGLIDPGDWQTLDSLELYPGETVVLRSSAGDVYKLTCLLTTGADVPRIQVSYAPVPPTLPDPTPPASVELAFYTALDVETGETFTDPTVASVIFCDFGVVPTPTPHPDVIPEPGTGILLIMGLFGLCAAWLLARRNRTARNPVLSDVEGAACDRLERRNVSQSRKARKERQKKRLCGFARETCAPRG